MKKLLISLFAMAAASTQATTIQWFKSGDAGVNPDLVSADGYYTGKVYEVTFNDGTVDDVSDALINKYVIIDVNADKFLITTSAVPANFAGSTIFSGDFGFDITASNIGSADGYALSNVVINNSVGSAALTEFSDVLSTSPGALYTFSMQGGRGNGQVGTVPEPTSLGLLGLGLVGIAFAARRKKTA